MGLLSFIFGCGKSRNDNSTSLPKDKPILYSLATICDALPQLESASAVPADAAQMHEDDWRQVEFFDAKYSAQVDKTMADYIAFRSSHQKSVGFTDIFIRKDIHPSIESLGLKISGLSGKLTSLAISGRLVTGGFSVKDGDGAYLYGVAKPDGTIVHLGINPSTSGKLTDRFVIAVATETAGSNLRIADWYKGAVVEGTEAGTLRKWAMLYAPSR